LDLRRPTSKGKEKKGREWGREGRDKEGRGEEGKGRTDRKGEKEERGGK